MQHLFDALEHHIHQDDFKREQGHILDGANRQIGGEGLAVQDGQPEGVQQDIEQAAHQRWRARR